MSPGGEFPVNTAATLKGDPGWKVCGSECPTRRAYPNGRKRPADVCNRMAGHEGPHRKTEGATFRLLAEWEVKS